MSFVSKNNILLSIESFSSFRMKKGIKIIGQNFAVVAIVIFVTTTHVHFLDDLVKNGPFKNADTEVSKGINFKLF